MFYVINLAIKLKCCPYLVFQLTHHRTNEKKSVGGASEEAKLWGGGGRDRDPKRTIHRRIASGFERKFGRLRDDFKRNSIRNPEDRKTVVRQSEDGGSQRVSRGR